MGGILDVLVDSSHYRVPKSHEILKFVWLLKMPNNAVISQSPIALIVLI